MIFLKNCRLIPDLTEGYPSEKADVLIDNKIIDIKPCGGTAPNGAEVIDLNGKTLLPGLIDLHLHLAFWSLSSSFEALAMTPGDLLFKYYEYAIALANQGFTTIRDVGSDGRYAISLEKAIQKGLISGPRIIACGLIVTPTETGNDSFKGMYHEADGADGFLKACREELKYGAKFIKLMASGAIMNVGGSPTQPIITLEELKTAVSVAANKGTYVAAHCHGKETILMAIEAGVRTIEHGSFLDDECISAIKARGGCYIIPTMSTILFFDGMGSTALAREAAKKRQIKVDTFERLKNGFDKGLKYGWGSDIPYDYWTSNPGYEFIIRKEHLKADNLELLKQATIYSAKIAGIEDITGSIKTGKCADLIVVDGNPVEDIAVMTKKPVHVWCRGRKIV